MNQTPLLTVITPTYNRADFLQETIESVLFQDIQDFEYLIIDDGSVDDTPSIVSNYLPPERPGGRSGTPQITYLRHDNIGETRTVNKGLRLARGEFFTIVNSDDPLVPGSFGTMIDALRARHDALAAYPDWHVIDSDSRILNTIRLIEFDARRMLAHGSVSIGPGACFRRTALEVIGFRNPQLRYSADLDYWYRLSLAGPLIHVPQALATHRVHPASASISDKGTRLADETAYLFKAYGAHPLLPKNARHLQGLARANAHFAAIFCSTTLPNAARHLGKAVLANPVATLRRARAHGVIEIRSYFRALGGARNGLADDLIPLVFVAPSRAHAIRPLVRAILADPVGTLDLCEAHDRDRLIDFVRTLPPHANGTTSPEPAKAAT